MMVKAGTHQPAVHRAILIVDVERFGDPSRTNVHQLAVRQEMYRALKQSFAKARVNWASCTVEDRGDGVLVLVPPDVPKNWLANKVPARMAEALERYNAATQVETRIRLRMALHAGEVYSDAYGVVGAAITHAFRLIEAPALRSALRAAPGVIGLVVSDWFYNEVVRHDVSSEPASFCRIRVAIKETVTAGWIRMLEPAYDDHAKQTEPGPPHQTRKTAARTDRTPPHLLVHRAVADDGQPETILRPPNGQAPRLQPEFKNMSTGRRLQAIPENRIYLYRISDGLLAASHRRVGILTGTIRRTRCADIWVNSENTQMKMARIEEYSASAIIRYEGAQRDSAGRVVDDIIADELERQVAGRRPVAAGTDITTSSGQLARSHNVRYVIHVAAVHGEPGAGYRQVQDVGRCVTNALIEADGLFTRGETDQPVASILFPLLGTGQGGGNRIVTVRSMLGAAYDYFLGVPETKIATVYFLAHTYAELEAYLEVLNTNTTFTETTLPKISRHKSQS